MSIIPKYTVSARLMGSPECSCGDKTLSFTRHAGSKMSQFILLMLFRAPESVTKADVAEALYAGSDSDAQNSLKTLLFRIRKIFSDELGLPEGGILIKNGNYSFMPEVQIKSDVNTFRSLVDSAASEPRRDKSAALLAEAMDIYRGELLPALSSESWVIYENAVLRETYSSVVGKLTSYYIDTGNYDSAYNCYRKALLLYPYEEDWMAGCINALIAAGRTQQAVREYEEFTSLLFDELGAYPSEELVEAMRRISVKISEPDSVPEIKTLKEESPAGAFYCNYPSFVDSYRILRRIVEREGISTSLALFSVTDKRGKPMNNREETIPAMAILRAALGKTLRKSDMYTRFSRSQILVMFWNTDRSNVRYAVDRVKREIELEDVNGICRVGCKVLEKFEPPTNKNIEAGEERRLQWQPLP